MRVRQTFSKTRELGDSRIVSPIRVSPEDIRRTDKIEPMGNSMVVLNVNNIGTEITNSTVNVEQTSERCSPTNSQNAHIPLCMINTNFRGRLTWSNPQGSHIHSLALQFLDKTDSVNGGETTNYHDTK